MPAAVSTASWAAPLIWKKMRLWLLSCSSLSSSLRDVTIVRYARRRSGAESPSKVAFAGVTAVPFMSPHYIIAGLFKGSDVAQTVSLYRWDELALEKVTEMISRKIVTGEREMLAQIYLKKGALVPMHNHESKQMTSALQATLKF